MKYPLKTMRASRTGAALVALLALLTACGDEPTGTADSLETTLRTEPSLIGCPVATSASSSELVTPLLGGLVSVGGTSILVPAGGVLAPVEIRVTVPASRYVETEIVAGGAEHFDFAKTVVVTLDYSRCDRSDLARRSLTAWHIDPVTKALLAPMVSVDDKLTRRVTFLTDHLSGYAIAF